MHILKRLESRQKSAHANEKNKIANSLQRMRLGPLAKLTQRQLAVIDILLDNTCCAS